MYTKDEITVLLVQIILCHFIPEVDCFDGNMMGFRLNSVFLYFKLQHVAIRYKMNKIHY